MDRGTVDLQTRLVLSPPAAASDLTPGLGARLFLPADAEQLLVLKEEVSPDWSLKQDVPEPPHIKEEDEELGISHHGEQPDGLQEELITAVPFTAVIVKSEGDSEKEEAEFSQLHQGQTEDDGKTVHPSSSSGQQIKTESEEELAEPQADLDDPQRSEEGAPSCSETVDSYGEWQEPLSDSGPETEECLDRFQQLDSVQRHIQFQSGKTSSTSWDVNKPNADSQLRARKRRKRYVCKVCEKRFIQRAYLNRHMKLHTEDKPFRCHHCGKGFGERSKLKRHLTIHMEEKPFGCSVCGKSFTFEANLKTHMRVHTGEKPFSCDVCGKRFGQKSKVSRHMRVHTEERPFGCDICGKRFSQKGSLTVHVRIHTEEKPFCCDVCGKGFIQKESLKLHMRVHTGEKPFTCELCGKRCTFKTSLKTHMRVHTGEKPFSCHFCGKRFGQTSHLKLHIRVHTGENPFGCDVCGKRFNQRANLRTHMKVHTKTNPKILSQ